MLRDRLQQHSLDEAECTDYTYVGVSGTGDTNAARNPDEPAGRYTGALGVELESENVRSVWVPYPADAFLMSYRESSAIGVENTTEIIDTVAAACPDTEFLLAGYSQGADVMSRVLESIAAGDGPVSEEQVSRAVLLANLRRGESGIEFHGTASQETAGLLSRGPQDFGALSDRVAEICNEGGTWCDATVGQQEIGPLLTAMSLDPRNAAAVVEFLRGVRPGEDLDGLLDFFLDGTAPHLDYEGGAGERSAAEWALDYLRAGIR